MKRPCIIILFVFLAIQSPLFSEEEVLLKLPVRVLNKDGLLIDLTKNDFSFYINSERKEIRDLFGKRRVLDLIEGQRHFVLAFNLSEYGEQISDGINYFVDHILSPNDTLIVLTPIKMAEIPGNPDKARIKADIQDLVKKDSLEYKKNRVSSRENLLREIRKVNRGGSITSGTSSSGMTIDLTTQTIMQFLNDYSREWNNFKTKFLFPDMRNYSSIALMLARKTGEKWFVNFQQREIMPALDEFNKARDSIRNYLSSVSSAEEQATAASIASSLQVLEKSMMVQESFPREILLNLLLGANISYNTILFRSLKLDSSSPDGQSPDYEGILRDLSEKTGGEDLDTTSLSQGLEAIRKHEDFYYDLIFDFDGKLEDKNISIEVGKPEAKVYFKNKFFRSEIQNLIDFFKLPAIRITHFSLKGSKINFTLSEFKIDKVENQKAGMIRVKVELVDEKQNPVFKTENTLKSTRESITISLILPAQRKGYFQLRVQAEDLLSFKNQELKEYIQLK